MVNFAYLALFFFPLNQFSLHANEPTDVGNQPETVHVKKGLQEKIKAKHKENGTELPRTEMKEPDPPKPVSTV